MANKKWWQQGWWWSVVAVVAGSLLVVNKTGWLQKKNQNEPWFGERIEQVCASWGCLIKNGENWMVKDEETEEPADDGLATNSVTKLAELKLETVVSENRDRFSKMGINETDQVWLAINDKKLIIGDIASDYSGSYVKPSDEEKIYKTETVIDKNSWKEADSWRLKHVSNWPIYQIKSMSVDYDGKQFMVSRDEDGWLGVKAAIDKLAFLPVVKLWPDIVPDVNDLVYNFQLTMESDEIKTLTVGKRKISYRETKYWVSRDGVYFYEIEEKDGIVLTDKFN